MGVDCVFYTQLPDDDKDGSKTITKWIHDVTNGLFPGATTTCPKGEEEMYALCAWSSFQPEDDEKKLLVKKVKNSYWCRFPHFAYCHVEIRDNYFTVHDGCRFHLNVDGYQVSMLNYLDKLTDVMSTKPFNSNSFVLPDHEWPQDHEAMTVDQFLEDKNLLNFGCGGLIHNCFTCSGSLDAKDSIKLDEVKKCEHCSTQYLVSSKNFQKTSYYEVYSKRPARYLYWTKYSIAGYKRAKCLELNGESK